MTQDASRLLAKGPHTLAELRPGQCAVLSQIGGTGPLRQHFLDMGLVPGIEVRVEKFAPMGDPMQLRVHSYSLSLRKEDAAKIRIDPSTVADTTVRLIDASACGNCRMCAAGQQKALLEGQSGQGGAKPGAKSKASGHGRAATAEQPATVEHPGLGQDGIYHLKANEHPLPEGQLLTFALAGNQNCGKTTLFNQLTGANQHVGNFPGVTVEGKNGPIRGHKNTLLTDLPGIYSLSPYSSEEIVSRAFILEEKPTAIINIVDATNIERNLYLTMQLMELDIPMVVALNMMDEVSASGGSIRINQLEAALGVPVVPISAIRNEGVAELVDHALHVARYQERPGRQDFCDRNDHGGALHRCLHGIMYLIEDHAQRAGIPLRFAVSKVVEGDGLVISALGLDDNELDMIEHIVSEMEAERGLDRAAAIADMRFSFIDKVCRNTVVKPVESPGRERSRKIDRVLTGRFTAIPAFVGIMMLVFWLTFDVVGPVLQDLLQAGIDALAGVVQQAMVAAGAGEPLQAFVIDGLFAGVGGVLVFVPIIVTLFFLLSILEDTGYMARVAFVMDRLLRKIGLSGRSIVPMLLGFGCSVPAIMACRTMPSERDRKLTIVLVPFMSCATKMPIYAFLTAAFFPDHGAIIMALLYFGGIVVGVLVALVLKNTRFRGEAVPFVMELPSYRLPSAKSVGHLIWDKTADFLRRAFTVIFVATIVIWFLESFTLSFAFTQDPSDSILAVIAGFIAPVFAPLGFGDWRIATALITGFLAKESVISTLSVLFGSAEGMLGVITPLAALSLLVFILLYTPCVAAVASIKRELGGKWACAIVVFQCVVAWLCAFAVYGVGRLLGFA